MIGIIGLILAIVVMVIGAYRGLGALPLTILAALVAMLANNMPLYQRLYELLSAVCLLQFVRKAYGRIRLCNSHRL